MSDTAKSLAERLEKQSQNEFSFLQQMASEDWEKQIYSEGAEWTVRAVFSHIVASERSLPALFKNILEGGSGVPDDFDLNRYNERAVEKTGDLPYADLLKMFAERRAQTVKFVASLSDEDLQKMGRHSSLGENTLNEMIKMMYLHVKVHVRDIKRLLRGD